MKFYQDEDTSVYFWTYLSVVHIMHEFQYLNNHVKKITDNTLYIFESNQDIMLF